MFATSRGFAGVSMSTRAQSRVLMRNLSTFDVQRLTSGGAGETAFDAVGAGTCATALRYPYGEEGDRYGDGGSMARRVAM